MSEILDVLDNTCLFLKDCTDIERRAVLVVVTKAVAIAEGKDFGDVLSQIEQDEPILSEVLNMVAH